MDNQTTENEEVKTKPEDSEINEGTEEAEVTELKADESVEEKSEEESFKDKYFYLAADFDNAKKRFEREKMSLVKFGHEKILRDLVDVKDNFDLTVGALRKDEDEKMKNVVVGIDMISKQFMTALGKHGLVEVCPNEGDLFDPNLHEAMAQQEVEGKKENQIIQVYQVGYSLNDRLIRPAKVIVAK